MRSVTIAAQSSARSSSAVAGKMPSLSFVFLLHPNRFSVFFLSFNIFDVLLFEEGAFFVLADVPFSLAGRELSSVLEDLDPDNVNHLARHCCGVLPGMFLAITLHLVPWSCFKLISFLSSSVHHKSLLMFGSRWRKYLPIHCWSVLPGSALAICAHFPGYWLYMIRRTLSSSTVHLSLLISGLTLCLHLCAHCWPVRPGICLAMIDHLLPICFWRRDNI
mmetsp:Transcript_8468/g.52922  ORF Transcript_8468/g.52922 Transcript_8468/m.52922 type:complete len:219 (+) Transcript_8468:1548-2204(+)